MTDAPLPPTPDDKDWTWVLDRPCPECGFDTSTVDVGRVGAMVRENASIWQSVLARSDVRDRPEPDTWSPLEYACHVRDVLRIYLERLDLMLTEDGPHYPNWDQDATAIEEIRACTDRDTPSPALFDPDQLYAGTLAERVDRVVERVIAPVLANDGGRLDVLEIDERVTLHDSTEDKSTLRDPKRDSHDLEKGVGGEAIRVLRPLG